MFVTWEKNIFVFLCAVIFSANSAYVASSSKGIIGNIIPETGEYTAIDNSFTVTLPIKGTAKQVFSAITDTATSRGILISITPEKNRGTYRLETSHAVNSAERTGTFNEASARTFDWYRRLVIRSYRGNLIELHSQSFEINGRQANSVIYKQLSTKKSGPRFHLFYLVDFNNKLAFVWTDIALEKDNLDIEEEIIAGKAEQAKKSIAMLRSLKFN